MVVNVFAKVPADGIWVDVVGSVVVVGLLAVVMLCALFAAFEVDVLPAVVIVSGLTMLVLYNGFVVDDPAYPAEPMVSVDSTVARSMMVAGWKL
jgi:hypothetical protein